MSKPKPAPLPAGTVVGGYQIVKKLAEIGEVVEQHLQEIGMLKKAGPDEHQKKLIEEKKAEYLEKQYKAAGEQANSEGFPPGAQLCKKCNTKAAIVMDGCMTCLNCGESKCG